MDGVLFTLPALSRYHSRKEWEEACWKEILKSAKLLESLATSRERHNLVMRAAVINHFKSGKTYKQIGEELWLSPQTISAIKKAIKETSYQSYRERGKTKRKKKQYSSNITLAKTKKPEGRAVRTKYGTIYLPY